MLPAPQMFDIRPLWRITALEHVNDEERSTRGGRGRSSAAQTCRECIRRRIRVCICADYTVVRASHRTAAELSTDCGLAVTVRPPSTASVSAVSSRRRGWDGSRIPPLPLPLSTARHHTTHVTRTEPSAWPIRRCGELDALLWMWSTQDLVHDISKAELRAL